MLQEVYLLQHSYELESGCNETKVLGIFSSEKKAKDAIEMYKKLPGFCDHMKDLYIDKYFVDERCWTACYVAIN